jgi:hypothetical protein
VVTLQDQVTNLQDAVRKYEIESKLVGNVMATSKDSSVHHQPLKMVNHAKRQIIDFLNTRTDEVDHIAKAKCFFKYISDPFYMQVFVQNHQPDQWQSMIESIYEAIELPEPSFENAKYTRFEDRLSPQPIRARTSTLGSPLASAGNPMDRIAQHLGNMGI